MRQAGRSLPEYRALRGQGSILDAVRRPDLAAEITLQPVRRYGVDAAVLFSDIVVPLTGFGVDVAPGIGPVVERPFRSASDLDRLRAEPTPYVEETVRILVKELEVPLIGFAGGPFTLASYLIEGGPSKTMGRTKAMMLSDPVAWTGLLEGLADIALASLTAQVRAGAQAVQVFDSWVGCLSARDYAAHVLPTLHRLFELLRSLDVPRIYYGLGTGHLLESIGRLQPDCVGLDWRVPLSEARARLPAPVALQGNLDPAATLASRAALDGEVAAVLAQAPSRGYVFNLGHGVPPEADPAALTHIVELVHTHHEREDRP